MGDHVIKLPDVGEGVAEAELVGSGMWGSATSCARGRTLLAAVMTDKATVEIPSPVEGRGGLARRRDRRPGRGGLAARAARGGRVGAFRRADRGFVRIQGSGSRRQGCRPSKVSHPDPVTAHLTR